MSERLKQSKASSKQGGGGAKRARERGGHGDARVVFVRAVVPERDVVSGVSVGAVLNEAVQRATVLRSLRGARGGTSARRVHRCGLFQVSVVYAAPVYSPPSRRPCNPRLRFGPHRPANERPTYFGHPPSITRIWTDQAPTGDSPTEPTRFGSTNYATKRAEAAPRRERHRTQLDRSRSPWPPPPRCRIAFAVVQCMYSAVELERASSVEQQLLASLLVLVPAPPRASQAQRVPTVLLCQRRSSAVHLSSAAAVNVFVVPGLRARARPVLRKITYTPSYTVHTVQYAAGPAGSSSEFHEKVAWHTHRVATPKKYHTHVRNTCEVSAEDSAAN